MFSFLKKIFKKKSVKPEIVEEQKNIPESIPTKKDIPHMSKRFDIEIFDYDAEGQKVRDVAQGVYAESREELKAIYAQCGQKIRIIREYSDNGNPSSQPNPQNDPTMAISMNNVNLLPMPKIPDEYKESVQKQIQQIHSSDQISANSTTPANNQPVVQKQNSAETNSQTKTEVDSPSAPPIPSNQPMYFRIGDVDCKFENGQVYEKKWTKLGETDLVNYRLISDKTNKIIPFTGKSLEVLKWVSIKDNETETEKLIHQITNGQ